MLTYQATKNTVNLTFSKEYLNSGELLRLIEILRIKELLSKSQLTTDDAMALDDELKENWWRENQARFLAKIQ
ncbi:MAG: hypothetical protein Q8Q50_07400 [Methylobacter sp.]|jgi:hypothetical protein|nr:hypothetical protein [Methylobacter sp.]